MSRLYDSIEPNVISDSLLRECVSQQGPQGEAGKVANAEGIDFSEVQQLRLDFKNILRIENLWQFTSLRKLQLDNNIIEEVYGLDKLTHLEWLDLSFNNIEVISGLDKLKNLKDLSLANNRIRKIEHMDSLVDTLQILSLANNLIDDIKNIKYLREFGKLQTLVLKGTPVSLLDIYKSFTVAYIPSLIYLDFDYILEDERQDACESFADVLQEVELQEREEKRKEEHHRASEERHQLMKSAYVDGLQGSTFFRSMFDEDQDSKKIELIPGVRELMVQFEKEFVTCCEHLTEVGLDEKKKRDSELASFRSAHEEACKKNQAQSVQKLKEYEEAKTRPFSHKVARDTTEDEKATIDRLQHSLMWLEMQLVEQLDEITKDFELNYGDIFGSFKESIQSHMTQLRELESKHHEAVTETAITILEKFTKNELEEGELHDDLRTFFVDKDTLVSALNTAHDTHLLAVDNKEDSISQKMNKELTTLLEEIQSVELARNRRKVVEIEKYIENERSKLGNADLISPHSITAA